MLKKEDVLKVSKLARLSISEEEAAEYGGQFEKILEYFNALSAVNTDAVHPTTTPVPVDLFLREDQVTQTNSVEDVTSNAPELQGNLFKVPPVV